MQVVLAHVPYERYRMSIQHVLQKSQTSNTYEKRSTQAADQPSPPSKTTHASNSDDKLIRSK